MNTAVRPPVPGSMSNAAYEQRLRDAVMDAAPLLNAKVLPVGVRSAALNKALAAGLPQLRDDLWRYADLKFLASAALAPSAADGDREGLPSTRPPLPGRLEGFTRLVFVNGRHQPELSDECAALLPAATPLVPERTKHERFGWLNDAFATGVARLEVSGSQRIEVLFLASPGEVRQALYPRLEVGVAPGADCVLLERHAGTSGSEGMVNVAVQVHAGAGSQVRHLRWQGLDDDAQLIDTAQIALDRDAQYQLALLQLGARAARTSLRVSLFGPDADLRLQCVALAGGRRVLDHSLLVDHLAPRARSEQVFRAIARDQARIACRSRVEVGHQARGTSADQSLKGLLSGIGGEIDLRPQLEIHTDDVRASHGATTGALDEAMRFYLQARGLEADTARALLEWAFLEDALRGIALPALRSAAEQAVARHMGGDVVGNLLGEAR